MMSQLPDSTLRVAERNVALKATPSYSAWLSEVKDNWAHGDNSPSAAMQRRTNSGMINADHLWEKVIEEAGKDIG